MSKIRVLATESVIPVLYINKDELKSWKTPIELEVITSYDSELEFLFQEINRHQVAEDLFTEQQGNQEGIEWLEGNKLLGELGERLALSYLRKHYKHAVSVSHLFSKGYDIEVTNDEIILGFEIKASKTVNNFYITYNELHKAYKMRERYYLFYIYVEQTTNDVFSYYGIVINDPIKELKIDFLELTHPTKTGLTNIIPQQFRITIDKDFLESQNVIFL
ncbi:protein NO VEIN domain-containing protein [Fictibacillus sp. 26RED30]|uniref:protein NO VEIN domain-containing protein n=1 Tax=Fictibacillus sp. 26RED30 TaxID=2745877 RepID=UPI0018CD7827|nr:DUF3883 domain-containing protein [Fictibacillus sp. 26RED30]MBH0162073.1 DUF3883 domain-containing protein [Fictibacillus sp. 26RED30]